MQHILRKALTNKYLIGSVAALLLYALVGFIAVPQIAQWYLPKYVQENLHCRATIDRFRLNPFLLTLEAKGFNLTQADGTPLVAFARFFVDLEMSSLFHWAIVVREVDLDKPDIHVAIEPDGSINLAALAGPPSPAPEPAQTDASNLIPFILHSLALSEGQIAVVDKRQSTPADFTLQGLNLQFKNISTVKGRNGTCHLAATTEQKGAILWDGEVSLSPLRSKGKIFFNAIATSSLWKFLKDSTNLEPPTGQLNVATEYELDADKIPLQLTLQGMHFSSDDLSIKLRDTEKPLFHLKKIDVEIPRFDLATRDMHISRLLLAEGAADVRISESGGINLQQILRTPSPNNEQKDQNEPPPPATPPTAGADQQTTSPEAPVANPPFKMRIDAIDVNNFGLALEDNSRKTPIKAAIAGADLHMQANLEFGNTHNIVVLQEIASEVRGMTLDGSQPHLPLFATEKLTIQGGECDLAAQSITVARIAMQKGYLNAGRDADGEITWRHLLQIKENNKKSTRSKPVPETAPAWKLLVKSFEIEEFSSQYTDLTTKSDKPALSLRGIKARMTEIDGISPMGFTIGFQVEQGGTATLKGTVNPAIPSVEADVTVSEMMLTSLQPYIDQYAILTLQSAAVSTQGHLRYGIPGDPQEAAYEGNFSLNKLRLAQPGAKKTYISWDAIQVPKFKLTYVPTALNAQEIKISKPVGEVIIEEDRTLNLTRVLKNRPDAGTPSPPAKTTPKKGRQHNKENDFAYQISKMVVENGDITFADLSLRPRFKTRIHDLNGSVTGLSSQRDAQAKIQMDGQVDKYGIAKIRGTIRSYDFGRASTVDMVFRNLEMKNLSPYSGKFAGRLITSGKFSADLNYTLQDYKMTGENKIVIDNLSLGEQVDNPDATNLPLDLAIALLKDSNGRIDIGLPVTGDLNDPQFSVGPLVWKVLTNLITGVTTAPFRALGNLFGGESENINALKFAPGSSTLPPPEKEKLVKLAEALKSRPQLQLIIQGRYSPDLDGLAFKERSIRKIVTTRLGEKLGPNDKPNPLDFSDSNTQDILEELYTKRFGQVSYDELEKGVEAGTITPRMPEQLQEEKSKEGGCFLTKISDSLQLYKMIPGGKSLEQSALWGGELYTRLVEQEKVADKAFVQLANERAQSIARNLEGEVGIAQERVSIKDPESLPEGEKPAATLSLGAM